LAFNAQKFRGSRDSGHAPFSKNFSVVMSGLHLGTCVSNLKSVSLTVLELSQAERYFKPCVNSDTSFLYGKSQISTPYEIKTPERILMKFGTVD